MVTASWPYLTTEGLLECVRQALASRDQRRRRGRAARRRIMAEHTYRHRAMEIVRRLGLQERQGERR
jgi:spore maturation protein CgeB